MIKNLPYVTSISSLEKMLEKIKTAAVPPRFTQDFVATKLSMKSSTARAVIPFIKKMGLVASDGTPTELYKKYRNPSKSGQAIAEAITTLYAPLFEMNEYAHELKDKDFKGLVVEATGAQEDSRVVEQTVSTFRLLRGLADFELDEEDNGSENEPQVQPEPQTEQRIAVAHHQPKNHTEAESINLSYTINLNLPPTTDIEVFNAIFSSLKEHLLKK